MTVSADNELVNPKIIEGNNKSQKTLSADTGVEVVYPLASTSDDTSAVGCNLPLGSPGQAPLVQSSPTALCFFLRDPSLPRILCKFCEMPTLDGSFFHPRCRAIVEAYVECDGKNRQKFVKWLREKNV